MTLSNTSEERVYEWDEGAVAPRRRRRPDDPDFDITPMIDITFLLLIFFLVAAKMNAAAIKLPEAEFGDAESSKNVVVFTVIEEGGEAAIYKGRNSAAENRISAATQQAEDDEIGAYVKQRIDAGAQPSVMVMAEGRVKYREIDRLMRAAQAATPTKLHLAVLDSN